MAVRKINLFKFSFTTMKIGLSGIVKMQTLILLDSKMFE